MMSGRPVDRILGRLTWMTALARWPWRRPMPFVQQLTVSECGAACLAMVLRYHGRHVRLDELRDAAVSARDATDAQTLIETAAIYGLRGRAVTLDLDQLSYLERGTILHWNFTHFVVLDRVRRGSVDILDPARGLRRVAMPEFSRAFTGVAVTFEPADTFRPGGPTDRPVARYLQRILSERGFLPHILVASVLLQAFGLGLPLFNRVLIDQVIPHQDYDLISVLAVGFVALVVFQFLTTMVRSHLLLYLRTRLDSRLTQAFMEHLLDLPFEFFQRRSAGDLLNRLASNAVVREILTGTVLSGALDGALAIGYLAVLLWLSVPMALLTMVLGALQVSLFVLTRRRQRLVAAEGLDAQAKSQSYLVETLSAVETLKSAGAEHRAVQRWSGLFARELNVSLERGRLEAWLESLGSALKSASSMALLAVGTLQVLSGRQTLGDMMALIAVANGFLPPLVSLVSTSTRLHMMRAYMERLDDVFQTPKERDRTGARRLDTVRGAIGVDGVSFRYGPISPLVVQDVTIDIHEGEFVAIVGRSGSGKSTLARLLVGIYIPSSGRVTCDGVDLTELDMPHFRRQAGVVTQHVQLFGGTVRSNIALSNPDMPMRAVIHAAKLARVHDDIVGMPMGYETALIDRGASLSGGQQQRLALARALATAPRILILDEATNQLDAATERAVQDELAQLACTRIVIAHRLSTIAHADRILVMDKGRIVEAGTHAELLAKEGAYAALVTAQLSSTLTMSRS